MREPSSYLLVKALLVITLCMSVSFAAEVPSQIFTINNATVGVTTNEIDFHKGIMVL